MKKSELSLTSPMKSKSQKISLLQFVFNKCFSLTSFNKALVDKYLDIPYVEVSKPFRLTSTSFSFNLLQTKCGYACSDQLRDFFKFQPSPRS